MNKTEISNAIECWGKERLITYIAALQEAMYSACLVSLDLCDTCDLEISPRCEKMCPNYKLREDIRAIRKEQQGDTV